MCFTYDILFIYIKNIYKTSTCLLNSARLRKGVCETEMKVKKRNEWSLINEGVFIPDKIKKGFNAWNILSDIWVIQGHGSFHIFIFLYLNFNLLTPINFKIKSHKNIMLSSCGYLLNPFFA